MSSEHPIPGTAFEKTIVLPGFDPPRAPPKPATPAQQMPLLRPAAAQPGRSAPLRAPPIARPPRPPPSVQLTIALPGDQLTIAGC